MSNPKEITFTINKTTLQQIGVGLLTAGLLALWLWAAVVDRNNERKLETEVETLKSQLQECKAEALAWYNANATQSNETLKWMLQGQQNGTLDYTISQMYAKQGHDLHCIEPILPKE